jgi:gluconokinase
VGAALLGWCALGELPSLDAAADLVKPVGTVAPEEIDSRRMARSRPALERIYEALRELDS